MSKIINEKNNTNNIRRSIIGELLIDEDLVKMLYYTGDSNPLNKPSVEDVSSLIGKYIFKTSKASNTISEEGTYIFTKFIRKKSFKGDKYRDIDIILDIACHNNVIDNLESGDDRLEFIIDLIENTILKSKSDQWLGKMKFINEFETNTNNNFISKRLVYRITQLNWGESDAMRL